ncbi:MAG: hypothetical protein EBQ71_03970 [Betaproteobacteria bacterium]|nr:hypothetical protein [Betaproteobacteria bacterium]
MTAALPLVAAGLWLFWMAGLLVFRRRPELRVGTAREFVYPIAAMVIALGLAAAARQFAGFGLSDALPAFGLDHGSFPDRGLAA